MVSPLVLKLDQILARLAGVALLFLAVVAFSEVLPLPDTLKDLSRKLEVASFALIIAFGLALNSNGQVRADILHAGFSHSLRLKITILGHFLLLLPFAIALILSAKPFFVLDWQAHEEPWVDLIFKLGTIVLGFLMSLKGILGLVAIFSRKEG